MSDILIKNIEMPKEGGLVIEITKHGQVAQLFKGGSILRKGIKAIALPPHGRLIEESKTRRAITRELMDMRKGINPKFNDLFDVIQTRCELVLTEAPTILEANT